MPLEIQNKVLYADRTVQDWHRHSLPSDHDAIDLDLMGVCHRGYCRDPLYFIEATTRSDKPATILRRLAERCGVFGIVVQHDTDAITGIRVVFNPYDGKTREIASEDVSEALRGLLVAIREDHDREAHRG